VGQTECRRYTGSVQGATRRGSQLAAWDDFEEGSADDRAVWAVVACWAVLVWNAIGEEDLGKALYRNVVRHRGDLAGICRVGGKKILTIRTLVSIHYNTMCCKMDLGQSRFLKISKKD